MRSTTVATALAFVSAAEAGVRTSSTANHTCVLQEPFLSCSTEADPAKVDSCCVETFGGLVLATQFWSTYTGGEDKGQKLPAESWGIHGLWPDFCDGSYTQYCDLKRQYDPHPSPNTTNGLPNGTIVPPYNGPTVDTFLEKFDRYDLLEYMNKYWIAQNQPNHELWAHEFSKHATCFSTFDVECYGPQYVQHEELVQYYETAIKYYQDLPTYDWLADADIKPSNKTKYSLTQFQDVLYKAYGALPFIGCSGPRFNETVAGRNTTDRGFTVISEAWYYSHVYGQPQAHDYEPVNASASYVTNCAKTPGALTYPKRSKGSESWY
ncbi:ribonuclease T2 [Pseudovirgaria hyperparasitica]|uniref:ribonuclease T2 n=1 Tax=Pseudovirgaria hyperparasitica TaxID=470096 RepID=A0A6A6W6T1_9PEZI|nr:ribonuclease T2 [Pseudovirgaria hyperparasitica]KAF2757670.1 ribonuclease T2 [Pseudovirgaria hyperparasitica]